MMDKDIIGNFGILYRTFVNYSNEYLEDSDISFAQSVIIATIGNNEGISQEQISVKHFIDRAAVARNVKELEQKGYLATYKSDSDKRRKILVLSKKGKALYSLITEKNVERMERLFEGISVSDKKVFMKVMSLLVERV